MRTQALGFDVDCGKQKARLNLAEVLDHFSLFFKAVLQFSGHFERIEYALKGEFREELGKRSEGRSLGCEDPSHIRLSSKTIKTGLRRRSPSQ